MKRLVIIFSFLLLFLSGNNSQAACYGHYYYPYRYGPYPVVVCHRVYHSPAWIPGYWRWSWRNHRYFWIPGYWY